MNLGKYRSNIQLIVCNFPRLYILYYFTVINYDDGFMTLKCIMATVQMHRKLHIYDFAFTEVIWWCEYDNKWKISCELEICPETVLSYGALHYVF